MDRISSSTAAPTPVRSGRDPLLDLWRGLALVDMAWVHLANHPIGMPEGLGLWIGEHTRFAAGCFVLLSGMTVGRVFGPSLAAGGERRRSAVVRLMRRSLLLAFVGPLASIGYAALDYAMRAVPGSAPRFFAESFDLATYSSPGATGGLLLLYSLLLLATPLLQRFHARFGGAATLAASLGIFVAAQLGGQVAHWPPWVFPLPHWQILFVAGFLAESRVDHVRDARGAVALSWRVGVTIALALIFVVRSGPAIGVEAIPLPLLEFRKVPLRSGELLWYIVASLFVLTWTAWLYERSTTARRASRWLRRLGSWSLLVYVAHLLMEPPILLFVDLAQASPWLRAAMLLVMAGGMHAVAVVAERADAWEPVATARRATQFLHRLVPTSGLVGSGVATAAMLTIVLLHGSMPAAPNAIFSGDGVADGESVEFPDAESALFVDYETRDGEIEIGAEDAAVTLFDASLEEGPELVLPEGEEPFLEEESGELPIAQ
jgi:hypothetical protein